MANFLIIIATATFLLCCIISFFFANSCFALCFQDEKEALLLFKNDLTDNSGRLSSWIPHVDCCKWEGVVCDNVTGHVTELRLHNPGKLITKNPDSPDYYIYVDYMKTTLGGKISPSLLKLNYLYYLDLSYNDFGGIPIPNFIGSLQSLQYLNFSESGFGRVTHHLGNLSNLHTLGLSGADGNIDNLGWLIGLSHLESLDMSRVNLNKVSNWLHEISMIHSLKNLYLSECNLHQTLHLPISLSFSSLALLDLSSNDFKSSIPRWIFDLHNLAYLNLRNNDFHGSLPHGIGNLTSLQTLDVSFNNLNSSLPHELFTLKGLVSLDLSNNSFSGPIPSNIGNNTMLKYLDISFNEFNSSIPKGLYRCKSLESLNFGFNQLQGVISSDIGNLTSLTKLDLSYNAITGVPREIIGNLCKLEMLDLSENRIKASISEIIDGTSICSSIAMKDFILRKNFFYGHLTEQLGEFKNLRFLVIVESCISGPLPSSIGKLSSLEDLRLYRNKLNGTIPETFWQLSKLKILSIADNMLEGEVTQYQLDNLTSLTYLSAYRNPLVLKVNPNWNPIDQFTLLELGSWKLGSQIPLWLPSLKKIKTLDLSLTGISGPIPSWFWNFSPQIRFLNLSHNHLFGEISSIPNSMQRIQIYLSSNQLSGPLPHLPSNNSVVELDLSNNSFTGDMSAFLCDMMQVQRLEILNLGRNLLFGEIPDCWINWPELKLINLANNNLTGSIPKSFGHLKYLRSLDLHNNSLFGQIPLTLKECSELLKIDLGQNYLSGNLPTWLESSLPRLRILILRSNKFYSNLAPEICFLTFLQVMDIAENNISGKIPNCFNNFTVMTGKMIVNDLDKLDLIYPYAYGGYRESAYVATKGNKYKYDKNLAFLTSMDMSNNNFSGDIPEELTDLVRLKSLNLSGNHLSGNIPKNIGQMRQLESLDLSRNLLSGKIPLSMSGMSFLNFVNVSYNNLSGEIPSSTQMHTFNASSFIGNKLYGLPLTNRCTTSEDIPVAEVVVDKTEASEVNWLYIFMSLGYVVGLWGVLGILLFNRSWRQTYFQFIDDVWDTLCDFIILRL